MQIREVMSKNVKAITPDSSLTDAAKQMRDGDFGAMPVYEGSNLVGMITDRDIAVRAVAEGKDIQKSKVRDAMTNDILTCKEEDDVNQVTKLMSDRQIRRVPVVDRNQKLVGMVAFADLARSNQASENAGIALGEVSEKRHDEPGRSEVRH